MSSIIRSRNCDMVVSFADLPTGRLMPARSKGYTCPPTTPTARSNTTRRSRSVQHVEQRQNALPKHQMAVKLQKGSIMLDHENFIRKLYTYAEGQGLDTQKFVSMFSDEGY